ncbi:MAG: DUF6516 family protein [Candidatus Bipolaricaulota bacterium]|nr:DUF6516 family protein [Candidatus Bipolaricaulota bacterium]
MPPDARRRRWIAERCWQVYDLITRHLQPAPDFHLEFPEAAELAILSGALQVRIAIPPRHSLEIHEEYEVRDHELIVAFYSYVLLTEGDRVRLRADPLPHHRVDYRGRKLAHFPHHLHDEHGRIQSFSGRLEDFLAQAAALIER